MNLKEWILDGCVHTIAWIHILCMSFINMSHIVEEFWECKWPRYLACYAEHRIMKINHMLDHYENADSSFGRTKQLLSCLPMSIGIYRKRMCRRKRHLRTCSGSSILKHPSCFSKKKKKKAPIITSLFFLFLSFLVYWTTFIFQML